MKKIILGSLFLLLSFSPQSIKSQNKHWADQYNITWSKPSVNSSQSMPLGGGDIGCNVWVESGDLLFYIQRSGCFSENGEYLKLGRMRVHLSPNPFSDDCKFNQTLHLKDGTMTVSGRNGSGISVKIKMWVDIFTHSVHLILSSSQPVEAEVFYENWRTEDRELTDNNRGRFGCFSLEGYPGKVIKHKDDISFWENGILFYHRNPKNTLSPDVMIEQQGLSSYKDEITNGNSCLTFGGYVCGTNLKKGICVRGDYCQTPYTAWSLQSNKPSKEYHIQIVTHIKQAPALEDWKVGLKRQIDRSEKEQGNIARNGNWWQKFWNRSWIITDPGHKTGDLLWEIGRNYQLFRYQLGCNMYGEYPTKFNGGSFTFDPVLVNSKKKHDPDWRQWGGDVFTAQNQRLLYWPMLKSGDFEGMFPQFNLYRKGLNGARLKVKKDFGHDGAAFCEYANDAGLDFGAGWGWKDGKIRGRGKELPFGSPEINATNSYFEAVEKGVMANGSISYHWESQVEHAFMILEYNRFTERNIDVYMPFIKNALIFFDEHYQKRQMMRNGKPLDEHGKLVFYPSTSCESYRGAKNPTDLISGIHSCIERLLVLQSDSLSRKDKQYFASYLGRLPELSYSVVDGDTIVLPAESYVRYQNVECPQFYPLFPFDRYDFRSSMIPIFRNTWKHGKFPKNMVISWHQDGIFYARMGMVQEAYDYNMKKLKSSAMRFPTFWGPGHDWTPDHNWGGSGMIGLQEMLLQTVGDKIYILPCWPKDKDVHFKLHAPRNTVVEVKYQNGRIHKMKVSPKSRLKDVVKILQ